LGGIANTSGREFFEGCLSKAFDSWESSIREWDGGLIVKVTFNEPAQISRLQEKRK
jgi:hypothetical protein